jgi:microcystin degradation protein MlrC
MIKIAIAQFHQESNSFSPVKCGWEMVQPTLAYNDKIIEKYTGTRTEMNGFFNILHQYEVELVPIISFHAVSSGPVITEVFEHSLERIKTVLENEPDIDGILLCLHGATIIENYADGCGELLRYIRAIVPDIRIACTLDLHANLTRMMVENADIIVAYDTFPHIDLIETGERAASLLVDTIEGRINPVMAAYKIPNLVPGEIGYTGSGPMKVVMDAAAEVRKTQKILSTSVFQMQPWLDVYESGNAVLVITDNEVEIAKQYAQSIGMLFWNMRHEFQPQLLNIDEAISLARGPGGVVVLGDSADGTGSGAPGDSSYVLRALLERGGNITAYLTVVDVPAVHKAIETGVGNETDFTVGGTLYKHNNQPTKFKGRVRTITDGRFIFRGPQFTGDEHCMGLTAVIQCRNIYIIVMERSAFNWDPALYRSVGLEPRYADLVLVKSPAAFRAPYSEITERLYVVSAPGPASPLLKSLDFKKQRRPMYPFNDGDFDYPFEMYTHI